MDSESRNLPVGGMPEANEGKDTVMQEAKKKVEGSEVGITARVNSTQPYIGRTPKCANPIAGEEQVISYIAGDLIGEQCQDFITHVSRCWYCLKEVVLWRAAQVLTEADNPTAPSSHRPHKFSARTSERAGQSRIIFEQRSRGTARSMFTIPWQAVGQDGWNVWSWKSQTRLLPM